MAFYINVGLSGSSHLKQLVQNWLMYKKVLFQMVPLEFTAYRSNRSHNFQKGVTLKASCTGIQYSTKVL